MDLLTGGALSPRWRSPILEHQGDVAGVAAIGVVDHQQFTGAGAVEVPPLANTMSTLNARSSAFGATASLFGRMPQIDPLRPMIVI